MVSNHYNFTNLSNYTIKWELVKNGLKAKSGEFNVEAAPEGIKKVVLQMTSNTFC